MPSNFWAWRSAFSRTRFPVLLQEEISDGGFAIEQPRFLDRKEFVRRTVTKHLNQSWIHMEEIALQGDPINSKSGVLNEAAITRFAFAKGIDRLPFRFAQGLFFVSAEERHG
jgi:hypothetical protein